jgi:hypothetical protein
VLEGTWRGDGRELTRRLRISATARASGIPTVGNGHAVVLAGGGWRVVDRPRGGRAQLVDHGDHAVIVPDETGRWLLADAAGRELPFRSGRADELPLDCARADCHPRAGVGSLESPMTTILARALDGGLGAEHDPRCGIACHAAGEPGLPDGGFTHVASELGFELQGRPAPSSWDALPRALRRVGGVGCIACHGPAAVPEPPARWSVLRADACAVCHDAPPRYGHVAAWRSSRMARADVDPRVRAEPCARCHTTSGFLADLGVRPMKEHGAPPAEVGPVGVACAACHATHGDRLAKGLVRRATNALYPTDSPSGVCVRCHDAPASTVAILRGGAAPHAKLGCLDCHQAGAPALAVERGAGHAFKPALDRCGGAGCHQGTPPLGRDVRERALALAARLGVSVVDQPHASGTPEGLRLVLDDRGAGAHNAAYARQLLDAAEGPR